MLPGALQAWAAIVVWALVAGGASAWAVLGVATLAIGGAQVVKVLVPRRRLRDAGVPRRSIVTGQVLAIVGFFRDPGRLLLHWLFRSASTCRSVGGWAGTRPRGTRPGRRCV